MYDIIELSDWESFVISRLSENWEEIHELQKERRNKCKYHHRIGCKGYIGVVDKKIVAKDEEVDRALLWKVAREDKSGKIVDEEVAELAGTIEKLLKEKKEGLITVSGYNDVLAMALGTPNMLER
ncbi:PREDICTED: transposase Ptta/En/Spm plant [Prunus dulcis]|uniref:PREDICTED: transposase Ptta/En/Spm plant n=1 Tax=Prunus dulcis TaxID=3755 RepID=A0A5E4GL10_PRUDU|nr:PREDICTED: transposase Ptta/En/Spm plant [Prunus dulcis]